MGKDCLGVQGNAKALSLDDWENDDTVPLTQRRSSLGRKGRFSFRYEKVQEKESYPQRNVQ